jgi:hypothetical protein
VTLKLTTHIVSSWLLKQQQQNNQMFSGIFLIIIKSGRMSWAGRVARR